MVQARLLLQLLLTILFVVYFGLPSVDRFLLKKVRPMHITYPKGDGGKDLRI